MNKILLSITCALLCTLNAFGATNVKPLYVKSNIKGESQFAIFADSKSFINCKSEILEYKKILESENLAVTIIAAEWTKPEEIKNEIDKLATSKTPIEGMVFVGNIPIVRIRKAQFLTTAFKMNEQKYPMIESSVTSDRYYDTPSLKFAYIGKDSVNTNFFYYNLLSTGSQKLEPAYYSARIIVPEELVQESGISEYEWMKKFFKKAVAAHKEQNKLDKFIYFAGSGYNSDCLTAWMDQPVAFKTYFPEAFKSGFGNKFLNYRQDPEMKFQLFNEMQRTDIDLFMFYEHGAPETQYINGEYPCNSFENNIEELKRYLRNTLKKIDPNEKKAFIEDVCNHFGLSKEVLSNAEIAKYHVSDSAQTANRDIHLSDLSKLKLGSRMTIFNACYNGSFHQKGYVAGYHIFNDGNTVVTQGNTVNVLQDKWADELIGLLSIGARAGFWQNEVTRLESHLIGDPTFRFNYKRSKSSLYDINYLLVHKRNDAGFWRKCLDKSEQDSHSALMRALAVKKLSRLISDSDLFFTIFNTDKNMVVRLQALEALSHYADKNFTAAVAKGLTDPYEMIRRQCASYSGKIGDPALLEPLNKAIVDGTNSQRVAYDASQALSCFADYKPFDITSKRVKDNIRLTRNYQMHAQIPDFLKYLASPEVDLELRIMIAEALGWYNFSYKRADIVAGLKSILTTNGSSLAPDLKEEIQQTLGRLKN